MIQATSNIDGPPIMFTAFSRGLVIYLDNWAMGDLAEGDPSRRRRFISAMCSGVADLMFSEANAVELAGLQGESFDAVKTLLDEIGPNWFPVELNVFKVIEREQKGVNLAEVCLSEGFMQAYFDYRTAKYLPGSGKVIGLSDAFYRLGAVLDWVGSQRDRLHEQSVQLDGSLQSSICGARRRYEGSPLRESPFNESQPTSWTTYHLVRALVAESNKLKAGDGMDFCHAIIASSFASIATLDKHWKRRIESLPKPNRLALIYCAPELDTMVTDLEALVKKDSTERRMGEILKTC